MAEKSGKNKFTLAMVLMVVVVLVLGVIAISDPIGDIIENSKSTKLLNRLMSGDATVNDMADYSGMTAEEFLASYTVEGITGDSSISEFQAALTLKDYCEFSGTTYDDASFETYKSENGIGDDVTADTTDMEVKTGYANYIYELEQATQNALNATTDDAENATAEDAE